MKKMLVISLLAALIITAGCPRSKKTDDGKKITGEMSISSLAGLWHAEDSKWKIRFDEQGNLVAAINSGGMYMKIAEGGLAQPGRAEGSMLFFFYGPSYAKYDKITGHLNILIDVEHFRMQLPEGTTEAEGTVEGSMKYKLDGKVSDDGKRWIADLHTTGDLLGMGSIPGDKGTHEILIFNKVDKAHEHVEEPVQEEEDAHEGHAH